MNAAPLPTAACPPGRRIASGFPAKTVHVQQISRDCCGLQPSVKRDMMDTPRPARIASLTARRWTAPADLRVSRAARTASSRAGASRTRFAHQERLCGEALKLIPRPGERMVVACETTRGFGSSAWSRRLPSSGEARRTDRPRCSRAGPSGLSVVDLQRRFDARIALDEAPSMRGANTCPSSKRQAQMPLSTARMPSGFPRSPTARETRPDSRVELLTASVRNTRLPPARTAAGRRFGEFLDLHRAVGWAMCSSSAARVRLPSLALASNTRSWEGSVPEIALNSWLQHGVPPRTVIHAAVRKRTAASLR